jgi:RHS repeat-associated protein
VSGGGSITYLHHDQQGSTRLLTGSTGIVTGSTTFDAYGNKTGSTGSSTTPLGYDGQYTSSDTGLIYLRARVYDPATTQFLSLDPAAALTRAPYGYGRSNPLTLGDPSGMWFPADVAEEVVEGGRREVSHGAEVVAHVVLDVAAVGPYALYYGSYQLARGINDLGAHFGLPGELVSHLGALSLVELQALGLEGDVTIDALKKLILGRESLCDEGKVRPINPLHEFSPGPLKGPVAYLPGVHENGEIDIEW